MRNPQTVSLTWKHYPESKPRKQGWYLWSWKDRRSRQRKYFVTPMLFRDGGWYRLYDWRDAEPIDVDKFDFAYAELPEPYREDLKSGKCAYWNQDTDMCTLWSMKCKGADNWCFRFKED